MKIFRVFDFLAIEMRQLLPLFVTFLALYQVQGQTFENNGYKDLVVSIHPDVPATNQQQIIDNLKVSFSQMGFESYPWPKFLTETKENSRNKKGSHKSQSGDSNSGPPES